MKIVRKFIIPFYFCVSVFMLVWEIALAQGNRNSLENYASNEILAVMAILGIGIISAIIWVVSLRKTVQENKRLLRELDKSFDSTIAEKLNALELKKEAERKSKELEETKKTMLRILGEVQEEKTKLFQISKRLKLATESAKIGVWDWDIERDYLVWDAQMFVLYGIKKENFAGTYGAWIDRLYALDREMADTEIKRALHGEKDYDTSFRINWPTGGIRHLKAFAIVEKDNNGKPVKMIGVYFDITREKEIDLEKTEFVSLASHQLKTPVGSINWNLEMLLNGDYGPLHDKQREVITEMYNMNQRMNELINSLLTVSRIDLGVFIIEPQPVDFGKLCDEVLRELEPRIREKKHSLNKRYNSAANSISADPKLLRIIFQNYISNAIKYTRDGGIISVAIDVNDSAIVISVSNNGDPIPEKDQNKIFTKLFRARNAEEQDPDGSGLGLYIVKKIAEGGGGKVWFESGDGRETVFYASFPLSGMLPKVGTKVLS